MRNHHDTADDNCRAIAPNDWVVIRCRASRQEELIHLSETASPIPRASTVTTGSLLGRLLVGRSKGDIVPFHAAHGRLQLEIIDAGDCGTRSLDDSPWERHPASHDRL